MDINDEKNQAILRRRIELWEKKTGPKQGDFVRFADGELRLISHVWDCYEDVNKWAIQTSKSGSLYFGDGYMDFSGGLDSGIDFSHFKLTDDKQDQTCWFFDHDWARAGGAVYAKVPAPVWVCDLPAPKY